MFARTDKLTDRDEPNWMLLFIDADSNHKTGWLGYDLVVNRQRVPARRTRSSSATSAADMSGARRHEVADS